MSPTGARKVTITAGDTTYEIDTLLLNTPLAVQRTKTSSFVQRVVNEVTRVV